MTIRGFRGELLSVSRDPHHHPDAIRHEPDGLLVVEDGIVVARGDYTALAGHYPDLSVEQLSGLIVPGFIDAMMTNWAAPGTAAGFRAVLTKIDEEARAATGKGFAALKPGQRDVRLAAFDAAAFAAQDPAWRRFKNLALTGYYFSQAGATQELRYELSPGVWEPGVKMGPDTRAWAG